MNTRKSGIKVDTRKVDSNFHKRKPREFTSSIEIHTATPGEYVTMVKYEKNLAVWTMMPFNKEDYGQALKEGFKKVEKFKIGMEIF